MIHPQTRSGATLTEVLVAIFVMAIGLLALLTLFPLGALSMAQAIKDDRSSHAAKNAFNIAEAYMSISSGVGPVIQTTPGIQYDPFVTDNSQFLRYVGATGGVYQGPPRNSSSYFLNPYPGIPQIAAGVVQLSAPDLRTATIGSDGPSYPIYVDPWGWNAFRATPSAVAPNPANGVPVPYWTVGNVPLPGSAPTPSFPFGGFASIPRLPLSGLLTGPLPPNQWLTRWCTLADDITFQDDATPSLSTLSVQRENRYTWAWLLRRTNAKVDKSVDIQVIVYSGRSLTNPGETPILFSPDALGNPTIPFVTFDPNLNYVDIAWLPGQDKPPVRSGSWILDATMEFFYPFPPTPQNIADPHGYFYRVVGTTDLSSTSMRLELQTKPKKASFYPTPGTGVPVPYGVLIVMDNVVEVF